MFPAKLQAPHAPEDIVHNVRDLLRDANVRLTEEGTYRVYWQLKWFDRKDFPAVLLQLQRANPGWFTT